MVLRLAHRYLASQIRCSACPPPAPLRRLLQCRQIPRTTIPAMNQPAIPVGENLINMIRGLNANRSEMNAAVVESGRITAAEVKKVRRATEMETEKSRSQISRSKFACISGDLSSTEEKAVAISGSLDECGFVVAFENLVVLLPGEVVRTTGKAIPPPAATREQTAKELTEMEAKKAEIDKKAIAGVRRELWCGLGLMAAQTLGLMRLTFWELSWDVMEPICFFLASAYFMAGFVFFLRTSKEPTFQGFFECRFAVKQRRMMRDFGFDLIRFNELKAGGGGGEEACSWRRQAKL